ncbi:MAG: hypothetical protein ACNA8W_15630 [Bradymonadaceae bacterium]
MTDDHAQFREGEQVGVGGFLLDEEQALRKLQEFQLVSPHKYVLELVKAAHLLGATRIEFRIDTSSLELRFDGDPLTENEVDTLFSAFFSRRQARREQGLRHLAIGINAAHGLGLRELTIETTGDEPLAVCMRDRHPVPLSPSGSVQASYGSTRIYLRTSLGPGQVLRAFRRLADRLPEVDVLRRRCRYSRIPVMVNGEQVSRGFELPEKMLAIVDIDDRLAPREAGVPKERGQLGISKDSPILRTHILQHGVLIATDERMADFIGGWAVVESPRLTTNLSQSAFVENVEWDSLHKLLREYTLKAMTGYLRQVNEFEVGPLRHRHATLVLPMISRLRRLRSEVGPGIVEDFTAEVAKLPIFREATSDAPREAQPFISIDELRYLNEQEQKQALNISFHAPLTGLKLPRGRRALLVKGDILSSPQDDLSLFAGIVNDVTRDIEALEIFQKNRLRWEVSPEPDKPDEGLYPQQKSAHVDGLLVTAALGPPSSPSRLVLVKDGGRLRIQPILPSIKPFGLALQINGALEPNRFFDGPMLNLAYQRATWRAVKLLDEVVGAHFHGFSFVWQIDYLREVVFGFARARLMEVFGWKEWPEELTDCAAGFVSRTGLDCIGEGLGWLGRLAEEEIFIDVHRKRWSLRGMHDFLCEDKSHRIVLAPPETPPEDLVDERLAGQVVLRTALTVQALLVEIFPVYAQSLESFAIGARVNRVLYSQKTQDFLASAFSEAPLMSESPPPEPETAIELAPNDDLILRVREEIKRYAPYFPLSSHDIVVDETHPATEHALANPDDPMALAYLALAVYSKLNRREDARDCLEFHMRMTEALLNSTTRVESARRLISTGMTHE